MTTPGSWSPLPSMTTKRTGCAAVLCERSVMVMGGFDGSSELQSAAAFDLDTQLWSPLPSMTTKRHGCAAVLSERSVMVMGGYDGSSGLQSAEELALEGGRLCPSVLACNIGEAIAAATYKKVLSLQSEGRGREVPNLLHLRRLRVLRLEQISEIRLRRAGLRPGLRFFPL